MNNEFINIECGALKTGNEVLKALYKRVISRLYERKGLEKQ